MPRAVVTGGSGFLGSHLCDLLRARDDWEVVAVDNFLTGTRANVAHLDDDPGFTLVEHDVIDGIPVDGAVDAVLHLASPASPPEYLAHPLATLEVGSVGTRHALDLARANGARFLMASTSEIYGDPLVHPQPESYFGNVNSVGPRSVYDEAKRYAEAITMSYHREFGLDTKIVRIFNTYGPRLGAGRRPGGLQLPVAGDARRVAHGLRHRGADPFVLLRRRRGRGPVRVADLGPRRTDEHRQPRPSSPCSSWPRSCSRSRGR